MKKLFKTRVFRLVFSTFCVIFLMFLSYALSYTIIRKSAPSKLSESASGVQTENIDDNKPFPNLPVTISGTYDTNEDFSSDTNDYLVISENTLVNLYAIDKDENKTFVRILEIDLAALKQEDKDLLKAGILLPDRSSVLSLIEDYSS